MKGRCVRMLKRTLTRTGILLLALSLAMAFVIMGGAASAESYDPIYSPAELFSERDLVQEADLSGAVSYTVADGQDITITDEGVYVLSGSASGVTVTVNAAKTAKVQIVLDGVSITNTDFPCIYVLSADKVFVTAAADSSLSVTGAFRADGSKTPGGVIYSRTDLVLNGTAALTVSSSKNGIVCKDDLKVTGGTYYVTAAKKCLDANDSIRIADGTFTLEAGTDGLHAENEEDSSLGFIYVGGGSLTVRAGDDGVHATSVFQMDGGALNVAAKEGIEATYIQFNGGAVNLSVSDDGVNAASKSGAYTATVVVNGGEITVTAGAGDTDCIDSNRDIVINGGTVTVTGNSGFDYDGTGVVNGGTVIVNGQAWTSASLPNQMMGGGRGGWGGGRNGRGHGR